MFICKLSWTRIYSEDKIIVSDLRTFQTHIKWKWIMTISVYLQKYLINMAISRPDQVKSEYNSTTAMKIRFGSVSTWSNEKYDCRSLLARADIIDQTWTFRPRSAFSFMNKNNTSFHITLSLMTSRFNQEAINSFETWGHMLRAHSYKKNRQR